MCWRGVMMTVEVEEWFEIKLSNGGGIPCFVRSVNDDWIKSCINRGVKVLECKRVWRVSYVEIIRNEDELTKVVEMLNIVNISGE